MNRILYKAQWLSSPKLQDPNFEGSLPQKLGLENLLCPTCQQHLKKDTAGDLICLNGCHLIHLPISLNRR